MNSHGDLILKQPHIKSHNTIRLLKGHLKATLHDYRSLAKPEMQNLSYCLCLKKPTKGYQLPQVRKCRFHFIVENIYILKKTLPK